jgi:hypothetical protein
MSTFSTTRSRAPLTGSRSKKAQAPARVPRTIGDYVPRHHEESYDDYLRDRPVRVLQFVIDTQTIGEWRVKSGKRGKPAFSAGAITAAYMLRAVFHLSLRSTEGLMRYLFTQAGLDPELAPDYSTLSRNRHQVSLRRPRSASGVALIDGTGFSFTTKGPWILHKWRNDVQAEHRYVRLTLTTDAATGAVLSAVVTQESGVGTGETSQFQELVTGCVELGATTLIGDGAYDTKRCYQQARDAGVRLVTPPQVNATFGLDPDRDVTLAQVNKLGTKEWKKRVKYHQRSRVEADIGAIKRCFTDSTNARSFTGARADVLARASVMNLYKLGAAGLAA